MVLDLTSANHTWHLLRTNGSGRSDMQDLGFYSFLETIEPVVPGNFEHCVECYRKRHDIYPMRTSIEALV